MSTSIEVTSEMLKTEFTGLTPEMVDDQKQPAKKGYPYEYLEVSLKNGCRVNVYEGGSISINSPQKKLLACYDHRGRLTACRDFEAAKAAGLQVEENLEKRIKDLPCAECFFEEGGRWINNGYRLEYVSHEGTPEEAMFTIFSDDTSDRFLRGCVGLHVGGGHIYWNPEDQISDVGHEDSSISSFFPIPLLENFPSLTPKVLETALGIDENHSLSGHLKSLTNIWISQSSREGEIHFNLQHGNWGGINPKSQEWSYFSGNTVTYYDARGRIIDSSENVTLGKLLKTMHGIEPDLGDRAEYKVQGRSIEKIENGKSLKYSLKDKQGNQHVAILNEDNHLIIYDYENAREGKGRLLPALVVDPMGRGDAGRHTSL